LYFIATLLYPGGSDFDKNTIGFSWTHNYWCNLLNTTAINGLSNAAQPVAIAAMIVLAIALALFWWIYASIPQFPVAQRKFLRGSAIASMLIAALLATSLPHDFIINAASLFGMIAVSLTLIGLYKSKWDAVLTWGFINILLVIANNVLYYNSNLIQFLPIVQKISFASYLLWFSSINIKQFKSASP